jgi:hypothetical protein
MASRRDDIGIGVFSRFGKILIEETSAHTSPGVRP